MSLVLMRRDMVLDPLARVRVVYAQGEGISYRCLTCDDHFEWMEADRWWACQTCGIELTPKEAEVLLKAVKQAVRESISDASAKRGRWDWVRWLLRGGRRAGD